MKLEDKKMHLLSVDYITMQHAIFFKTRAEHKSLQQDKLYLL